MNPEPKVTAGHLQRAAYLYIRQSTLRQVFENTESTQRQYALRRRAVTLGWLEERIVVIEHDQRQSGASTVEREGFQRLVADVGLGNEANLEHPPKPVASHRNRHPDHAIVRVSLPASRGLLAELRPNPDPGRAEFPPERAFQRFRQRPAPALAASLAPPPPQDVVDETPVAPARLAGTGPHGEGARSVVVTHD